MLTPILPQTHMNTERRQLRCRNVQGTGAEASKEANKQVEKDDDAKLSTRATAAKDALVDKKDEKSHDTKADVHKGKFIHLIPSWPVTYKFYRTS
jgi:hypothetical protein